jgi:hypothetical protein
MERKIPAVHELVLSLPTAAVPMLGGAEEKHLFEIAP